ncbi:MAG: RluA family pseudouridine synthase [Oligoflexia bacterium]|nr:RluA family pseudouridine synthase [Oligoflexia bacterium]
MSELLKYNVTPASSGQRLDVWLGSQPEIQTRTQAARLIDLNKVKVSGVSTLKVKASYRLRGNETIEVEIPPPTSSHIQPEDINFEIIYQDYDVAVVNKPAPMVTHPSKGNYSNTLVNGLLFHIKDLSQIGGVERPGLVHRLDKDTSGLLVIAKNDKAYQSLATLFKTHNIHRVYWALVAGVPRKMKNTIISNLARHPKYRKVFCSQEKGKHAITHYEVVETYLNQLSLLKVTLETGRTHQIRVHLSEMGNPIVGDKLYGIKKQSRLITSPKIKHLTKTLPRHVLHAAELGFEHPRTKEQMQFKTSWPDNLKDFITQIKELRAK